MINLILIMGGTYLAIAILLAVTAIVSAIAEIMADSRDDLSNYFVPAMVGRALLHSFMWPVYAIAVVISWRKERGLK